MNDCSDIGEQLQEAREKRELSLQDVAHEARIPFATLQALEENDYSSFASPAYTKSFLQQYSEFLKIDVHDFLENFNTGNVLAQSDSIEYLDQKKSASLKRTTPIRRTWAPSEPPPPSLAQPLLILLITVGLIGGGIWG
ncbi:MAG: cytoskeletal protein RodZ, partial [Akkermansiaceae bacterium]